MNLDFFIVERNGWSRANEVRLCRTLIDNVTLIYRLFALLCVDLRAAAGRRVVVKVALVAEQPRIAVGILVTIAWHEKQPRALDGEDIEGPWDFLERISGTKNSSGLWMKKTSRAHGTF